MSDEPKKDETQSQPNSRTNRPPGAIVVVTHQTVTRTSVEVERDSRMGEYQGQISIRYELSILNRKLRDQKPSDFDISEFYDGVLSSTRTYANQIANPLEKIHFLQTVEEMDLSAIGTSIPSEIATKFSRAVHDMKRSVEYGRQQRPIVLSDKSTIETPQADELLLGEPIAEKNQKIKWEGGNNMLLYFFKLLYNNHYLSSSTYENRHHLIAEHFLDKRGGNMKAKNLKPPSNKWNRARNTQENQKIVPVLRMLWTR